MVSWLLRSFTVLALLVTGLVPLGAAQSAHAATDATQVHSLRTNALVDPLGVSGERPRLSWKLDAERRGVRQTAYQVRVGASAGSDEVWDSGRVDSDRSVGVEYAGPELRSHTRYHWSVRVWDERGEMSGWSDDATFETGLLAPDEWTADWITGDDRVVFGPEWRDVTVAFTASGIEAALGVYFRGRDTEHAYMWQLSEAAHALRPHVKDRSYRVLEATAFPENFDFTARHRYEIEVSGTTITTRVDGEVLDQRADSTFTGPGSVGFRTSGGESGTVHDVEVTSADGDVLVATDFPRGDHTFKQGTVTSDGLVVGPGSEAWLARGDEVPLLRKDFTLRDADVERARVYASARGVYELQLNGKKVGDQELAPGWADYRKRIQYQTYDVTDLLREGDNALGAQVADGWFSGRVGMFGPEVYGTQNSLIAQLRVEYADGTSQVVGTDESWRTTSGPILAADLLDGERYDARRAAELAGWGEPGYDDADWDAASVVPSATDVLEPQDDQPVRETQELSATRLEDPANGTFVYDLGQNMVGKVRITIDGEPGDTVRIRHAEVLNPDGSLYTENLRTAQATDHVTLDEDGSVTYEPTFTFHGFRYVEITGVDEAPDASDVTGVVMGTDGELVNDFETSSAMVNQLQRNITWGMRGNFLSIPTDTPARDERLGWTGDIDVFSQTAVYNMDSQAFLRKWLQDLRDSQRADGALPGIAPVVPGRFDGDYGPAGWADAGVHVPYVLWRSYGDEKVVRDNYDMMKRYVDYLLADSTGYIRSAGGYLDWLNLDDPTPADVLDTAFMARSTREFVEMAEAIGRDTDAAEYRQHFEAIRQAYQDAFVSADGTVKGDSQTAYILTINNALVPASREKAVTEQFIETIERRDWHLSTGFLGVDGLLPALTAVGRTDVAYRLLQNEDYPSWGYEISKGATTIWERWNSIMPDGSFGDAGMNSFNHYAYGAVGEWMYRTLAGISPIEPGYGRIKVAPAPGDGIDWARMSHETPYGTVASHWRTGEGGDELELDVTVPANTTAEVHVPAPNRWAVREGGKPVSQVDGVEFLRMEDGTPVFEVGSGDYRFSVDTVLGHLGSAVQAADGFGAVVDGLEGDLPRPVHRHLQRSAAELTDEVTAAWGSRAATRGDTAAAVHRALSSTATIRRWVTAQEKVGRIPAADATRLRDGLQVLDRALSAASAELVGAVARLVPPQDDPVQGGTATATLTLENRGDETLRDVTTTLESPDGWQVEPVGTHARSVQPGQTLQHAYRLVVPDDADPSVVELAGIAEYRWRSGVATLPVTAETTVAPAVVVDDVSITPGEAQPGEQADLQVVVANRADDDRDATVQLRLPAGWPAVGARDVAVPAGGTATAIFPVSVPLEVTEGPVGITASIGAAPPEQGSTTLAVAFTNPPEGAVDHVDLGDAASEQAHGLTASPASGTSVEGGLTRRYTNSSQPGGWFELDLAVPSEGPVLLRMIETYDQAQYKTYDLVVDGEVVRQRRHRRAQGGAGTVTYQVLLDRPDLTSDGTVRIRFQDVEADYDPSIADLWSVPAPTTD